MFRTIVLDEVIGWIHDNIDKPLHIKDIANKSGYSTWHFQRLFKEYKGKTLGKYVAEVKMRRSYKLLSTTRKSLIDITLEVGFANQQSFARKFREYYGVTPSHIRRLAK